MRYALVKDGVVENVVIWDGEGDIFKEFETVLLDDNSPVNIDWEYDGTDFVNPNEPAPLSNKELYDIELSTIEQNYTQRSDVLSRAFIQIMMNDDNADEKEKVSQSYRDLMTKKAGEVAAIKKKYGVK